MPVAARKRFSDDLREPPSIGRMSEAEIPSVARRRIVSKTLRMDGAGRKSLRTERRCTKHLVVVDSDDARLVRNGHAVTLGGRENERGGAVVGGEHPTGFRKGPKPRAQPPDPGGGSGGKARSVELADRAATALCDFLAEGVAANIAPMIGMIGGDVGVGGEVVSQKFASGQAGHGVRVGVHETDKGRACGLCRGASPCLGGR